MTEHTPTPWRTDRVSAYHITKTNELGDYYYSLARTDNGHYCTALEAVANAAHIVRCVNAHDDLVAALRGLIKESGGFGTGSLPECRGDARALLAKLEGAADA